MSHRISSFGFCTSIAVVLIVVFVVSAVPAHAQEIRWIRQFGTTRGDKAFAVAKGPSPVAGDPSRVCVAGETGGRFPGDAETTAPTDDSEAFVSCFKDNDDPTKTNIPNSPDVPQQLWSHAFGSSTATSQTGEDSATGVTIDSRGDVYVVGHVQTALAGQTSQGDFDAFIRKYSADGVLQWTNQFGTDHTDDALGVANDGTTVYVIGYTEGTLPNASAPTNGLGDGFIRAYSSAGLVLWTRQFGESFATDKAFGVATDGTGVYVTGTTAGDLGGTALGGVRDGFLRKYNSSGDVLWTSHFGTVGVDDAWAVAAGAGGVFVGGETSGTFQGQTRLGGLYDAFVAKFDQAGNQKWVRQFGTNLEDAVYGLAVGASSVIVAGYAEDTLAPSTGIAAVVRLYSTEDTGDLQSSMQFGDGVNDSAYAVAADSQGAYVVGTKTGTSLGTVSLAPGLDAFVLKIKVPPPTSVPFTITNNTGISTTTDGTGDLSAGQATIEPTAGSTAPSGVAIFGFSSGGVLVSEAGVPDSPLITSGRTYVEVSGTADVNTGLAIANPSAQPATITFVLIDLTGAVIKTGSRNINARSQVAEFLTEAPYLSGNGFQGTLTFTSTIPVGVIALRSFINERSDFLITTLPVIDLSVAVSLGTQVIPHFAVGDGWKTQILLINPTDTPQAGTVQFFGPGSGSTPATAATVTVDGASGTTVAYTIPGRSSRRLVVTPAAAGLTYGSVRIIPASSGPAPTPLVVFGYKPGQYTLSEAGVPVISGTAFRMYAEASAAPVILSGIAASNNTTSAVTATLELATLSGVPVGVSTTRTIPANGQIVGYLSDFFPNLPQPFKGILRVSVSSGAVSVVALRQRYNERGDYLITTTPPSVENRSPVAAARSFPHIVNGGGYTTQFVLFSGTAGQSTAGSMKFYKQNGSPMPVGLR